MSRLPNDPEKLAKRLEKLAGQAVHGDGARNYYRWAATRVPKRELIAPVRAVMLGALLDGTIHRNSRDAERRLIHHARMQLADIAQRIERQQRWRRRSSVRADWMPSALDGGSREQQRESFDILQAITRLTVRQMMTECEQEDFNVVAAYFDGYSQRGAAEQLSAMLGRHVSVGEYNAALTEVRLNLAEWLTGVRLPAEALGPWPYGRGKYWRRECDEVAGMLSDIAVERKRRRPAT